MNKETAKYSSRREALEKDLMAVAVEKKSMIESGSDRSTESSTNKDLREHAKKQVDFATKQGYRRRHPGFTLSNFAGPTQTGLANPKNTWEKYLHNEHERVVMPKEYISSGDNAKMITQAGISETADKNFKKSKPKLSAMYASGI